VLADTKEKEGIWKIRLYRSHPVVITK